MLKFVYETPNLIFGLELNNYIATLDKRRDKRGIPEGTGLVAKKIRRNGAPSTCKPPPNAPTWAVQVEGTLFLGLYGSWQNLM